ncbi:kinase [Streptomyces sp. NP160]|uniref:aminoglycoside phosphotransferase family protein n=1 Tax=Streptomyces sp. NP160 TaxID=2586637 RepID=UPI00111B96AC|nr:aminoglycoside phosphotransferase family protein [Streptomyces sp. NP160]TNM70261.1 kinase [Streptomyces sp. NP160]
MVDVPEAFARAPRWRHDRAGRAWVEELPGLVTDQCRRLGLVVDGSPWHGSNALVVPVVAASRPQEPLALRLAPPGDDVTTPARALRLWAGRGAVLLHDVDDDHRALLLERLDGSATLADVPLVHAVEVLAELAVALAVPVPADLVDDVPSTASAAAELAASFETDGEALRRPVSRVQLDAVMRAARARAAAPCPDLAVDGDLHPEQVLRARRAPWLVVDPLLLRGDLEHDLGRVLWSRLDEADDGEVVALFDRFVDVADVPRERARDWVLVRAASYLVWGLRHGLTEDPPRCRRLLDVFS